MHTSPYPGALGPSALDDAPAVVPHTSAAAFDANRWDGLVGSDGSFYASHAWIRSLDLIHGPHPVLAAIDGELRGVLPTWTTDEHDGGLFDLPSMTQGLILIPSRHMLWLGPRRATASSITCASGAMRPRVLYALLEAARRIASAEGFQGAMWPYLTGENALEAAACHPLAQAVLCTADTVMAVPVDGKRTAEAAARSKDRRVWRREQERFEEAGAVEWTALTPDVGRQIAPLLATTRAKYGSTGGIELMHRTLWAQRNTGVACQAIVALARNRGDDAVRAAAVFYSHNGTLYGRYWGTDGSAPPGAYFVLTIYQAIDWAAQHGLHRLHLSVPATAAKIRRGAQTAPLGLVYLPVDESDQVSAGALQQHNQYTARLWAHAGNNEWARWTSKEI